MGSLCLCSTAAIGVKGAGWKHAPHALVTAIYRYHDTSKKLGNRIGTRVPGGDGKGHLILHNILKDRPHFWKGICRSPRPINDSTSSMGGEGSNHILVTVKWPQSVVTVKDDKRLLLLRHWGTLTS